MHDDALQYVENIPCLILAPFGPGDELRLPMAGTPGSDLDTTLQFEVLVGEYQSVARRVRQLKPKLESVLVSLDLHGRLKVGCSRGPIVQDHAGPALLGYVQLQLSRWSECSSQHAKKRD